MRYVIIEHSQHCLYSTTSIRALVDIMKYSITFHGMITILLYIAVSLSSHTKLFCDDKAAQSKLIPNRIVYPVVANRTPCNWTRKERKSIDWNQSCLTNHYKNRMSPYACKIE